MKAISSARTAHRTWLTVAVMAVIAVFSAGLPAASADVNPGDQVYVGDKDLGYGGTGLYQVFEQAPPDPDTAAPDFWAYCIEHDIPANTRHSGVVGDFSDYVGDNYVTSGEVQGKVLWILAHSYPAMSLGDFADAAGIPGLSQDDAIEATQYAIWRYTDLTYDAPWDWETEDSEDAYWYLVNGANAAGGLSPDDFVVTVSIDAPSGPQAPGGLIGPFVVSTNQPTVRVSVDPAFDLTDADGDPVDADAVVDGQELYLDLRATQASGSATITVAATGLNGTGRIISVGTDNGGNPTADDHAQTMILVAPSTATTTDQASVTWQAPGQSVPSIGTTLTDADDGDHVVPWDGGTVTDTVEYQNLVPGTEYTLQGELMVKSDGSATGITGSVTFTPTSASGSIDVEFTIPKGYAGQQLVAFESLYADGNATAVAVHHDLDDAAQTVTVEQAPGAGTAGSSGDDESGGWLPAAGSMASSWMLASAAGIIMVGAALMRFGRQTRGPRTVGRHRG